MPTSFKSDVNWFKYENELYSQGFQFLGGIDEAGRGPLAGPVTAACVTMPRGLFIEGVNDSKKISEGAREELFDILTSHPDIQYGVGIVSSEMIDKVNILQATLLAMELATKEINLKLDYLLVDGVQLYLPVPSMKIIRGDSASHLIAAASILAKVTRDRIMREYHERWPEYGFMKHKGYGTKQHREAIKEYGPCEIHRKTFEPIRSILSENLAF